MINDVLCTCVWCLQGTNGQGKLVSRATCARHLTKQKKTWPKSTDMPTIQRQLATPISTLLPVQTYLDKDNCDNNKLTNIRDEESSNESNESLEVQEGDIISEESSNETDDLVESLDVQDGSIMSEESSNETVDLVELLDVQDGSMMSEESFNETDNLVELLDIQEGNTIFEESSNESDDLSKSLE
ncbi:3392_t:CDS:1, partial [Cetraspora pellucida]